MSSSFLRGFLHKIGLDSKELRAWAFYDVANSAFASTIMVAILPVYFNDAIATDLPPNLRSAYWAYFNTATMIVVALVSPSLGYLADVCSAKKKYLAFFTALGSLATALLVFLQPGQWMLTGLLFVLGGFAFHVGVIFYEALLPHITTEENIHRVSNSGFAMGYLGGGIVLAINLAWILKPDFFGLPNTTAGVKLSFLSVSLVWIMFSLPLFRRVREPHLRGDAQLSLKLAATALFRVKDTLLSLKKYPQMFLFLASFWAYSDGVGTIMNMGTIYGREVGIASADLVLAVLLVQFIGVPASLVFGPITHAIGAKKALNITLFVYLGVSVIAYFMNTAWHFWLVAVGIALVQGANQAISRSIFASMVPLARSGEFFGLFSIWARFAGLFGPLVFGLIAANAGGSRISCLFIVALFVLGIGLLHFVDIEKGRKDALLQPMT